MEFEDVAGRKIAEHEQAGMEAQCHKAKQIGMHSQDK